MSIPKKLINILQRLCHQTAKLIRSTNKRVMSWLLRRLIMLRHQLRPGNSGFVLPTVVMVIIVVTLLSTAIVFRSFDRAKNAQNVRVNERVMAAAAPAIERAQAKIQALLADPTLPRGTPTDQALYQAMTGSLNQYTLGDETPLRLVQEFNGESGIQDSLTEELNKLESLDTAWRFPVDTDNNGNFDSYTLYGLYFRNPTPGTERDRSPLEARSTPMDNATAGNACGTGTSASLVGNTGWYKTSDGNLKKSFFVFAATVPIENPDPAKNEEKYKGNQGFAALEYQQDQARIPLTNNAVVYQDDLEITPGSGIFLNGRIMTNGNFFVAQKSADVRFFQVSSINSCFYNEDNGKITVGGNLKVGSVIPGGASGAVTVDLFKVGDKPTEGNLRNNESSVSDTAAKTSYNSTAYAARIDDLVTKAVAQSKIPDEVTQKISLNPSLTQQEALQAYFEQRTRQVPFAEVPDTNPDPLTGTGLQGTVAANDIRPPDNWIYPANLTTGASNTGLTLNKAQPPATDPALRGADEERLGDRIQVGNGLPAQWWDPDTQQFVDFYDQVPQPVDGSTSQSTTWTGSSDYRTRMTQVIPLSDLGDTERDGFWEQKAAEAPVQPLDGVGGLRVVTGAGIYVPDAIATPPTPASFLPRPSSPVADDLSTWQDESGFRVVLPDSMPMWDDTNNNGTPDATDERGDLLMRATAVYHYRDDDGDNQGDYQEPIACVSSYYDPSTPTTAINRVGLPNISLRNRPPEPPRPFPINNVVAGGLSNNGVSYPAPTTTASSLSFGQPIPGYQGGGAGAGVFPTPNIPGTGSLGTQLAYQANLVFPNGRLVNQPLHDALVKKKNENANNTLTLAEQGAIDSAICALQIWDGTLTPSDAVIPHGTIYETTFLDAKQVKGIESESPASGPTADYDLALEERQPLEIRATVLDLDLLRRREITGTNTTVPAPEYLLPDSGIIYATRDDALPDLSTPTNATGQPNVNQAAERISTRKINSPVDFILDPTRRPNGIMLINGSTLARGNAGNDWKQEEKGLILASNLPVYVKANELAVNADAFGFNLHRISRTTTTQLEEFKYKLSDRNWNENDFYINREEDGANGRDPNFACRKDQPGLPGCDPGDYWRPATVLADSVTLLSNNFRFGFRNEGDYDLRKNVENLNNNLVTVTGYDFNSNGTVDQITDQITEINSIAAETALDIDLNGDGDKADGVTTASAPAEEITEQDITITAARRLNGFFDNNYLTSANWADGNGFPAQGSSYVNNFVTPIQRRRNNFSEYVMEICRRPMVSECTPNDWVVGYDQNNNNQLDPGEENLRAWQLISATEGGTVSTRNRLGSGTTARPPLDYDANGDGILSASETVAEMRYPRRVAFLRYADNHPNQNQRNTLVLDTNATTPRPVPLGINGAQQVDYFPYQNFAAAINLNGAGRAVTPQNNGVPSTPPNNANALWFRTVTSGGVNDPTNFNAASYRSDSGAPNRLSYQIPLAQMAANVGTTQQPLLVPVLQIQTLDDDVPTDNNLTPLGDTEWMQKPPTNTATTFNLIIVGGDTPTRDSGFAGAPVAEFNGGMPNFPIFLENWDRGGGSNAVTTSINGSFIQFKRSAYATAPFLSVLDPATIESSPSDLFNYTIGKVSGTKSPYKTSNSSGRTAFYHAPDREWGYDVGLLSQLPDLFSQQITSPSAGDPNEYYRELSRDDDWVQTLLCATAAANNSWSPNNNDRKYSYNTNAIDASQRPSNCP